MPCGDLNQTVYGCRNCHRGFNCGDDSGCCACIPRWICVTFEVTEAVDSADPCSACDCSKREAKFALDCNSGEPKYSGTIVCGSMSLDLEFGIQRDDDDCSFCLSSTALDLSCVEGEITGGSKMSVPWSDPADEDGPSCCCLDSSWSVDLTSVTGSDDCETGRITTKQISYITPNWGRCSDCYDSCSCLCCDICVCVEVRNELDADRCVECRSCVKATYDPEIGS